METTSSHVIIRIPRFDRYKTLIFNVSVAMFALVNMLYGLATGESLVLDSTASVLVAAFALCNIGLRVITSHSLFKRRETMDDLTETFKDAYREYADKEFEHDIASDKAKRHAFMYGMGALKMSSGLACAHVPYDDLTGAHEQANAENAKRLQKHLDELHSATGISAVTNGNVTHLRASDLPPDHVEDAIDWAAPPDAKSKH